MYQVHYLAFAAFAVGCTYLWAFRERRITLSASFASATWALLALTGSEVVTVLDDGTEAAVPVAVPFRYFMAGLALLSTVALLLNHLGVFPPEAERRNIPDQESSDTTAFQS
jgi:hypothetical protein